MSDRSAIQWTEATWNPVTGCDKVSPGCGLPRWAAASSTAASGTTLKAAMANDPLALQLKRHRVSAQNAAAVRELHERLGARWAPSRRRRAPVPSLAEILAAERTAS
jgi:protein gp37